MSGQVNLVYPQNLVAFIESDIPFDTSDTDSFTWYFNNLEPFQTFSVMMTFNVNPPTDPNFPVNIDDILTYIATANPIIDDITPENNVFILDQTVVGSFDPNDILCLEGEDILIDKVGDFVHYRIRFENTGTFPAENIVVENVIDPQKFEVSSLQVLSGSHEFVTHITGNRIEFIFEAINLPFDDANNDGFILYKIRTLTTLAEGDSFTNSAAIYFDFNFPIETNNYSTIVVPENLSINDYETSDDLTIYPNPVGDVLTYHTESRIETIQIFSLLGTLTKEISPNHDTHDINVSNLAEGVYIIDFKSKNRNTIKKFIKI